MSQKRRGYARHSPTPAPRHRLRLLVVGGGALAAVAAVALTVALYTGGREVIGGSTAWSTLGTQDVHSLALDPADSQHLYFGHHGGLLETRDGGRTWQGTPLRGADAMNISPMTGGFFQIAGHNVYMETVDGGQTWLDVPNDLPGLDLHAFVTDPADTAHAWAFSVGFGLFGTTDRGRTWQLRQAGGWGALAAFVEGGRTILVGVGSTGLARSEDGGRTWTALGQPRGQLASLAASADGAVIYAGTTGGVSRSTDGGGTWTATPLETVALTVAVSQQDSNVVAVVDDKGRFFRSADGGATWPGP